MVIRPDQFELEDTFDKYNSLGVCDQSDPKRFGGTWQRQGSPKENHQRQWQRY